MGSSLELCSCPWKLCEPWLHKILNKNNYPLVNPLHYKIMCQDFSFRMIRLLVWYVRCKNRNFGCRAWFYILYWKVKRFWNFFAQYLYTNCLLFPNFLEFWELQKYGRCSNYYRLSCLRQILFLMHCFARFDETIDCIGVISHGKVILL